MLTHPQMLVTSPVFALSLFLEVDVLDTLLLASGVEVAAATAAGVGSAYFICGCIGAVALVFAIFCVKERKHPAKQAA